MNERCARTLLRSRRLDHGVAFTKHGEHHAHACAPLRTVFDGDVAVMFVDDLLHDGQSEPGTSGFAGHVRFEDAGHQVLWKTRAIVTHRQSYPVAKPFGAHFDGGGCAPAATALERVLRVLYQIVDDLPDLRGVGKHRGQFWSQALDDWNPGVFVKCKHLRD